MDELQKLYDVLVREGKFTKSFDEFKNKWTSEEGYQDRVFEVISRDGFYTKDRESFLSKYGAPVVVKKKEEVVLPTSPKPLATDLPLGVGSLEYAKPIKPVEAAKPVKGEAESLAVGPMGITGIERIKEYVPARKQGKVGLLGNIASSLDRGVLTNLIGLPAKGLGTFIGWGTTKLTGGTDKGPISNALIRFGDRFNKAIEEVTQQDEEYKGTLTDQFGQAFGQVAALIATQGAASALSKGASAAEVAAATVASKAAPTGSAVALAGKTLASELANPASVSAGLAMGQSEFDKAKQQGATDEQAYQVFMKNAVVGSVLEQIPVLQFLKRFEKASAGGVANYLKTKGVAGFTGGLEEMTTEVLQQLYANKTAQEVYNINQDLLEGVGESGGIGFGVGFILNAMGAHAKFLKRQGKNDEAAAIESQINNFESAQQAPSAPPAVYKFNGIKIESPEVINNMIDNMEADDLVTANFEITNDPELQDKLNNKIVTSSIKRQVREANPDIDEDTLDKITDLEKQLRSLEGNATQSGKDKAASIRSQIKTLQENAIQKQSTDEGVLRTEQPQMELQQVGEGNVQPEVATQRAEEVVQVKEEIVPTEQEQELERFRLTEEVDRKKNAISRSENTQQAIAEYNDAKKALDDFDASVSQQKNDRRAKSNIQSLIEDENNYAQQSNYEFEELHKQDPRLAALERAKDMVSWIESGDFEKTFIENGNTPEETKTRAERSLNANKRDIADLEADLEANPVVSLKTQEEMSVGLNEDEQRMSTQLDDLVNDFTVAYSQPAANQTTSEKRAATAKANKAVKRLNDFFGFVFGSRANALQANKQDALSYIKSLLDQESPMSRFANITELMSAYKNDKQNNVDSELVKSVDNVFGITPEAKLEIEEQYVPIEANQISHEKFTRDNAVDYEEDYKTGDNGREYAYISRMSVEVLDNNTGESIGNLVKIVDEDGTINWNAEDVDGNEIGKQDFDTKKEAQDALLDRHNKIQKKEFDKEVKKKAKEKQKAAEKEAKKKVKAEEKKTKFVKDETVQPQRAGDRTGRTEVSPTTPLEGAPSVPGVNGPDPQLVAVAEEYAKQNGIPFARQAEYVKVDEERAKKIADAYEAMANDPQNPKVKEAYQNLINQTIAQYQALVDAGYQFWFMDLNIPSNVEYASSPYNAIRDLRQNKEMGVFPTTDGYGDGGLTEVEVNNNPMLQDTGIQWPVGGLGGPMKNVLANDLFRAVHDAFGHGLEGAGFRARGEENAWQAHVRLFTGSAVAAITSETRGQNSWLNFGPHGEKNRTAKVEDTIFAEQKVGLMPEWTWQEGRAADMKPKEAPKEKAKPKAKPQEEAAPTAEEIASIDAMLDLDMNDEDNMLKVLNALDRVDASISKRLRGGANDALLAIPLSTVQLIVKSLKALVKGGMKLREAIRKVSADNNISEQTTRDVVNIADIHQEYTDLMSKVDAMIERQRRRGTEERRIVSNIDTYVRNSDVYQNATDAQKKILEKETRDRAGVSPRRAPSIGRILGVLKDITNVSRKDKLAIISNIRALTKDAASDLAKEIRALASEGKITVKQAANIIAKFGKVNMLSEISVSKFVDYMTKVFADAEYNSKLSQAKIFRKQIKSLSKNKEKNANLRDLAEQFSKIAPSMVDDIDSYNEIASNLNEAIRGSKIRGQKVDFAQTVNVQNATEYINKTLDAQKEKLKAERVAEIQNLMGVDMSEFSYEDLAALVESNKPLTKYNEGIVRDTINKAFKIFSSIINESINTGKDPFTGEDVKFTDTQKSVVKRFMDMDLNILKPKEALEAVDALANFLENQSTAKMESVVSKYEGLANAIKTENEKIKAFPLKKYWSRTIGRFLGEQTTPLPILFERMFKGFNRGSTVMDRMGLTKLINKKASAEMQANSIVEKYINQFYDKKVNGEAFNSAYNNVERGMASFMMRNVIGTEQEMQSEFDRRKGLIEESIEVLSNGNEKEKAKAELYKKAYEAILKDSKNIKDVTSKVDKVNLEAINFWMDEWNNKYEQLSDVAQNVYNKILDKDINYTPDRFFKLSSDTGKVDIENDDSAFLVNSGVSNLYQRETGVLMTAVRPEKLPVNPESGDTNRYIDLSFDNNNANSMYDALVDINTAAPIRQIQSFLNSSNYKNIIPNSDDARILKDRVQLYVRNIRDKNPFSTDEMANVVKKLNKIAAIGVGQALGGVTQPIKQVVPVAINTIINAGGLDLSAPFNQDKNDFISKSGYPIANRGIESQAQIESLNKLIDEVSNSKGEKLIKGIENLNKWWLDKFLVKPDVFVARASWMSYYEKYLRDNGIDTKDIDYSKHELNTDAANYAQRMVDRQQNVSDVDLSGKMFSNKESSNQLLIKTVMPFASFRMNQSARFGADLATLTNKTSTKEDKRIAARSVAGYASEMVTFRLISVGISLLLGSLAKKIMGKDEDDEEYEKRKNALLKGALTGSFTDVLSPLPIADKFVQQAGAPILQAIEDATKLPVSIYSPRKEEYLQNAGLFGIAADRALQLWELSKLSTTGRYTDEFGKEKSISDRDMDGLKFLIAPAIMTNTGLAPSEVNSVIRYAIKDAKKKKMSSEEKIAKSERMQEKAETAEQKIEALNRVISESTDQDLINEIEKRISEIKASPQEKERIKMANKEEKKLKESLLKDPDTGEEYDNETELKRYNPDLWEKNFGSNSQWYQDHQYEKEVDKLMNKEIRSLEDKEYGYTPKPKRKTTQRNSDGSIKRGASFGSAKFGGR